MARRAGGGVLFQGMGGIKNPFYTFVISQIALGWRLGVYCLNQTLKPNKGGFIQKPQKESLGDFPPFSLRNKTRSLPIIGTFVTAGDAF
ncbi:MAG: hypothetical protein H6581_01940 [Bacteroidia bacterium]|nr:hypothetical protein [Bacteroidia bacterium]